MDIFDIEYQGKGSAKQVEYSRDIFNAQLYELKLYYEWTIEPIFPGENCFSRITEAWDYVFKCIMPFVIKFSKQSAQKVIAFKGVKTDWNGYVDLVSLAKSFNYRYRENKRGEVDG